MNRVNLFVIGVNKAGTSWLHYLLDHHPDVFMADAKELYYFGDEGPEEERPETLEAYHSHFPLTEPYRYFGDATVMYYKSRAAAGEIQTYNPDAKLLAIVRDPIQRLLSQFQYNKQLGLIDEDTSVSEALPERDYLLHDSHYEETLPAYAERFGPARLEAHDLELLRSESLSVDGEGLFVVAVVEEVAALGKGLGHRRVLVNEAELLIVLKLGQEPLDGVADDGQ